MKTDVNAGMVPKKKRTEMASSSSLSTSLADRRRWQMTDEIAVMIAWILSRMLRHSSSFLIMYINKLQRQPGVAHDRHSSCNFKVVDK